MIAIQVEMATNEHLEKIGKLTNQDVGRRWNILRAEQDALRRSLPRVPAGDPGYDGAQNAINGAVLAKLSLLTPQWQKEEQDYRQFREDKQKQTAAGVEDDARRAVEFQRQRIALQKKLDSGAIDRASFNQQDQAALSAIASLRKKYYDVAPMWADRFDQRLEALSKIVVNDPGAAIVQSRVPVTAGQGTAGQGGAPDFDRDVRLAADIAVKREENSLRHGKNLVSQEAFVQADVVYNHDLSRLRMRWQAISIEREQQFERAYTAMAASAIQGLKVKYFPDKYAPVRPATPPAGLVSKPPEPTTSLTPLFVLIGLGLIGGVVWLIMSQKKPAADPAPPLSDNFGSANWAKPQEKPRSASAVAEGVMFGKSSHPDLPPDAPGAGAPVTSQPETHTLIVARTRAGKGTRVIVPTLLRYKDSMFVIDPKGENAAITARTRRDQLGHTVHIVNPWGEMEKVYAKLGFTSATFNPLDVIDRNDPNAVTVAESLAAMISPVPDDKNSFWQGSAAGLLTGVFLWLSDQPGEQKTLARAREIVTMNRADLTKLLIRMAASSAYGGSIKEYVSQFIDMADDTYSGIVASLYEKTRFLSDPRVKASTNVSSFSMDNLCDVYTTVYLIIPHDRIATHGTWLRLMISAAMQGMKKRDRTVQRHHRCMFMIDEFGSIGHIADMPRDIALMSGYGLDFTLIVQGLDQLKDHYGEAKGTILSNCAYKWFCYVNDLDTAKYLSDSLGKATVRTVGKSTSSGQSGNNASQGESTTYGETGRLLLTPDEILNLGRSVAILMNPHGAPHWLRPVDYWNLQESFAHLRLDYSKFYWEPPLQFDPNPYTWTHGKSRAENGAGAQEEQKSRTSSKMTEAEAREILEVGADATPDEIRAAYKRLMARVHPDRGGSTFFAKQLNAARAVLLGE